MLGEESKSADYWKKCGDEALANGVKGVIMMVKSPTQLLKVFVLTTLTGSTLGHQRRQQNRSCHQSKPWHEPARLRSCIQVRKLPAQLRRAHGQPTYRYLSRQRDRCTRE